MVEVSGNRSTRVRLELYASQLKNVAGIFHGTSDPFAVVTVLANDPSEKPVVLGKTEVVKNTLSPRWVTSFELDYEIGRMTRFNVAIFDEERKTGRDKTMGSAMFEVGEIMGTRGNVKAKKLRQGGTLFARLTPLPPKEERQGTTGVLNLILRGIQLKNVESLFGKSDPFFELLARVQRPDGGWNWYPVYRSQPIFSDLNPKWEPFSVDLDRLCNGDLDGPILFSLYDYEKSGKHVSMGEFETSVNGLLQAQTRGGGNGDLSTVDTSKAFRCRKKGKEYGFIVVTTANIEGSSAGAAPTPSSQSLPTAQPQYTSQSTSSLFASAIPPPLTSSQLPSFSQALDLPAPLYIRQDAPQPMAPPSVQSHPSSSAMAPSSEYFPVPLPPPVAPPSATERPPRFVDYLSGGCELGLSIAIDFTGSNGDPRRPGTLHYIHPDGQLNDYEKAITAVGSIIAKYDSDQKFPVWGFGAKYGGIIQHCFQVGHSDELTGISGVLEGYRSVFRTGLTMSGPTVFTEVISMAAAFATSEQDAFRRIGKQSYKMLLILTDGAVSDIEATKQAILAAAVSPLSIVIVGIGDADFSAMHFLDDFAANEGIRDICQFVEFSKFKNDRSALTRETLAEIPDQLVEYFFSNGIKPLPPISGSQMSLAGSEADDEDIDLSLDISPEGEVSLTNYDGAVYDDTKYDTYAKYNHGPPLSAYPTSQSSNPPAFAPQYQASHAQAPPSYAPSHSVAPPPGQVPASFSKPSFTPSAASQFAGYPSSSYFPNQDPPGGYGQASPTARVFHVRVPPGVSPGMQLQIENPFTHQKMIVVVPIGVLSGGTFPVSS